MKDDSFNKLECCQIELEELLNVIQVLEENYFDKILDKEYSEYEALRNYPLIASM
jgi:hypothetical protein